MGSGFSPSAGLKSGQINRERNYIFVINDEVSYEMFKPQLKNEPQNIESRMPKYGFAREAQVLAPRVSQFFYRNI